MKFKELIYQEVKLSARQSIDQAHLFVLKSIRDRTLSAGFGDAAALGGGGLFGAARLAHDDDPG